MPYKQRFNVAGEITDSFTYEGFSPYRGKTARIIAVFDGDSDMYDVDDGAENSAVIEEIKRMYRSDYDREPERIRILTDCA